MIHCDLFTVPATTEFHTYGPTLSLHYVRPITTRAPAARHGRTAPAGRSTATAARPSPRYACAARATRRRDPRPTCRWPIVRRRHRRRGADRESNTSELQSLMRISYAVFCLKQNTKQYTNTRYTPDHVYR